MISLYDWFFIILELRSVLQKDIKKTRMNIEEIRGSDQSLEYWDGLNWVPAVYHSSIRAFLIDQASRKGEYSKAFQHISIIFY